MRWKRGTIIILILNALLCAALIASVAGYSHYANLLESQEAAKRWQGDTDVRFAQISCFRPVGKELSLNDIAQFRSSLETALTDAAIDTESGVTMWVDAFSSKSELTVTGNRVLLRRRPMRLADSILRSIRSSWFPAVIFQKMTWRGTVLC